VLGGFFRLFERRLIRDGSPIQHDEAWMGRPVVSPESAIDADASILNASTIHQDKIVAQIEKMGLRNTLVLLL
jgi:hypothetical protein